MLESYIGNFHSTGVEVSMTQNNFPSLFDELMARPVPQLNGIQNEFHDSISNDYRDDVNFEPPAPGTASDAVNARFLIEDSLLQDGVTQYYFNQFENALKSLTILTELDPDNFEGLFTLALTLKSLRREAESNAILWRITNLHPQDEVDRNFREMSFKELQTSLENEDFESTAANANPLALFLTDCWQRIKRLIEQLTKSWVEKPIV